jgi:hypothetical protein
MAPSPSDVAPTLGVTGESPNDNDVFDGDHVTVCVANCTVIVIALLVAVAYVASAATLAVTVHVPTPVAVNVDPFREQTAPEELSAYVTCPVPSTPLVDSVVLEYTAKVEATADTVIGCGVRATVNVTVSEPSS